MSIHPTAIVAAGAQIDPTVQIGPYSVIGAHVTLGAGCIVDSHVVIEGHTTIGRNNRIHPHVAIGGPPQDQKYDGGPTQLTIGDANHFREFCTIHRGSIPNGKGTIIGNQNLIMANAHVAHDCHLENHITLANSVALAGHVLVGSHAVLGGLSAVHQHSRIGTGAMISGGAMTVQDVPPYLIAQGDRARLRGLNRVGLRRLGVSDATITALQTAYRMVFLSKIPFQKALSMASTEAPDDPILNSFFEFINTSTRGCCRAIQ